MVNVDGNKTTGGLTAGQVAWLGLMVGSHLTPSLQSSNEPDELLLQMKWHYGLAVGRSVTIVTPVKTAEPIEMMFGLWTLVGPRKHMLDGGPDPRGKGQY